MSVIKKRGLSPVVATVLLVLLAVVLAVIVFLWAKSYIGESIEKDGQSIELKCEAVDFSAEAIKNEDTGQISVQNNGDIPIYGIEVRTKKIIGEIKTVEPFIGLEVYSGQTEEIKNVNMADISVGDTLIIVPILLGETTDYKKAYVCDKDYGKETIVKE